MKKVAITGLVILICLSGFSQNSGFNFTGRTNPSVKKEKLNKVNSINDITPELWTKLMLPFYVREELDHRRKTDFSQGFSVQNQEYDYSKIIDYVSVEVSTLSNGKVVTAQNTCNLLSGEQKNILKAADLGSPFNIEVNFKFKTKAGIGGVSNELKTGNLIVYVVPETEAEYPGGFAQLTKYFTENLFNKIPEKSSADKILMASVKFVVDENGQITGSEITRSSTDVNTDRLILEATRKMPKWNPAKDANGLKVKQEFTIPFGGADGC